MKKEKKIQIAVRLHPSIRNRLIDEAEHLKRVTMTDIIEASLEYVLSLPEKEREKIILKFLLGKSD
ncbi:MAG: hypothetical protein AB1656_04945 [Candidatus Omnitrophota bacterium]